MNQPIPTPTKSELEAKAQEENDKLARLQDVAEDLEAEAQKLARVFDVEPSEEIFAKKAVLLQKAKNARTAVTEQQKVAQTAVEDLRRYERNTIGQELSAKERTIREKFETAVDLIAQGIGELDGAIDALASHNSERLSAQQQGVPLNRLSLEGIVTELSQKLARFRATNSIDLAHTSAHLVMGGQNTNNQATIGLHVQRSAARVPNTLH